MVNMEIVEKADEFFTVEGLKQNWAFLAVSGIFVLALYLRYMPERGMQYLQALDPYMIFRMSQHLAAEGSLPALDFARYFPYAAPIYRLQLGNILFPAVFYWMGPFLFFGSYLEWAQFYPALMGALGVVFAYLLGKELWSKEAGISAAIFLATMSGVMHRTSAGFFEKEPVGSMFMMVSLYFFTRAWKRDEWISGIASGLAMAFFTISWGGAKMLWLLYPLVTGVAMFLDVDIDRLVKAYTPTVIIGGGVASALNPTRFWFTYHFFVANLALVGFLWSRHLVEELEIIQQQRLRYYVPVASILGLIFLAISPLFWDYPYSIVKPLVNAAVQGGGGVIATTVAENAPASFPQLLSNYNYPSRALAGSLNPLMFLGAWTFMLIGVGLLGGRIALMLSRKFSLIQEKVDKKVFYSIIGVVVFAWILVLSGFLNSTARASRTFFTMMSLMPMILFMAMGGIAAFWMREDPNFKIEFEWYQLLPFFWVITNFFGSIAKSRLLFLGTFSVAIVAGYGLSRAIELLRSLEYPEIESVDPGQLKYFVVVALVAATFSVNAGAGYSSAQSIGGSPNQGWNQSLSYIESNTEEGSVILSWWDYGYWFESIGRRPAVADGGNAGYYASGEKINYPLADFLSSSNPENHTDFLKKHSVDYILLDRTMIGKYSAVSQISKRTTDRNEVESMTQVTSCRTRNRRCIPAPLEQSLSRGSGNQTIGSFTTSNGGLRVYAPIERNGQDLEISGALTLETGGGRTKIDCKLTEEGRVDFNTSRSADLCIAENPHLSLEAGAGSNSRSQLVLVPEAITDSTIVRLYLMDGYGIDFAEKVPEASNRYVRMWEVDLE